MRANYVPTFHCELCLMTPRLVVYVFRFDDYDFVIMKLLLITLMLVRTVKSCSYVSLFDYRYATKKDEYKYKYDDIKIEDTRLPEDAKEEAIMLIGGIGCFEL